MLTHSFEINNYPSLQEISRELMEKKAHKPKNIHSVTSIHDEKDKTWRIIVLYTL